MEEIVILKKYSRENIKVKTTNGKVANRERCWSRCGTGEVRAGTLNVFILPVGSSVSIDFL